MAALKGNVVLLKRGNGDGPPETFTTLAGMRTKNVTINNNPIDVTTDDDIQGGTTFRNYITGVNETTISGDGIATQETDFDALMELARSGDVANYQVEFGAYGTIEGPFRVSDFNPSATYDGNFEFAITLVSSGAWTYA